MPDFWNRPELDVTKPFASKERLIPYIAQFRREYEAVIRPVLQGRVLDMGCGTGWLSAWMSREAIDEIYAIDSSKHRVGMIAKTFEWLGADRNRLRHFWDEDYRAIRGIKVFDVIAMCAFFHHVDPVELLAECKRLLKPGGWLLIIGEQPITPLQVWLRRLRRIVFDRIVFDRWPPKLTRFEDLFPVDEESGDRYYRKQDYERIFEAAGWEMEWIGKGIRARVRP